MRAHIGFVAVATQVGYAAGLLFFVPLGDVAERRKLMLRMYAGVSVALVLAAFAQSLTWMIVGERADRADGVGDSRGAADSAGPGAARAARAGDRHGDDGAAAGDSAGADLRGLAEPVERLAHRVRGCGGDECVLRAVHLSRDAADEGAGIADVCERRCARCGRCSARSRCCARRVCWARWCLRRSAVSGRRWRSCSKRTTAWGREWRGRSAWLGQRGRWRRRLPEGSRTGAEHDMWYRRRAQR